MPDLEAIGDAATGAVLAKTVEPRTGADNGHTHEKNCLNCGAELAGDYCHACGQRAHVHLTLHAFWHDLLHGVLHFEGKIWRTLPLLAWRPGELTRRYIDGERAKFVSPMALFLFTVFVMFAVFSFTAGTAFDQAAQTAGEVRDNWQSGNAAAIQQTNEKIQALEEKKADAATPP